MHPNILNRKIILLKMKSRRKQIRSKSALLNNIAHFKILFSLKQEYRKNETDFRIKLNQQSDFSEIQYRNRTDRFCFVFCILTVFTVKLCFYTKNLFIQSMIDFQNTDTLSAYGCQARFLSRHIYTVPLSPAL